MSLDKEMKRLNEVDRQATESEARGDRSWRSTSSLLQGAKQCTLLLLMFCEFSKQVGSGERVLRTPIPSAFVGARDAPSLVLMSLIIIMI